MLEGRGMARLERVLRKRLEREQTRLLAEARRLALVSTSAQMLPGDNGAGAHPADRASDRAIYDFAVARRENLETRLSDVKAALGKMDAGIYGECEACGKPIPSARLRALPWARRCIRCQAQSIGVRVVRPPFPQLSA